ncbi:MAG: hypothetical protein ACRDJW_11650 [Thermomicrobiales bacterium]
MIETIFYPDGSRHPTAACLVCSSSNNTGSWSPLSDTSCGENGDQVCCGGACCAPGACCALDQICEVCDCTIDGQGYSRNTLNPANECEVCDPDTSTTAWSPDSDVSCGPNHDQVCCNGVCCATGACCALDLVCEACDCQIDGQGYSRHTLNPDNACEICDPDRDSGSWSPDSDVTCGPDRDQVCCNGVCCAPGACCALDLVCETCDCQIDGQGYSRNTLNPANACEICEPETSATAWSPDSDVSCGPNHDQVCCNGVCCGQDECCNSPGHCEACELGCTIDGVVYTAGTTNPNDACQDCNPAMSTTLWTIVPNDSPCGGSVDQVCCNGVCCNPNWCCSPFGDHSCDIETCGLVEPCAGLDPCGCTIDGVFYPVGTENPANDCQYCLISDSASAMSWTNRSANLLCGPDRHDHCCNGVCCEPAACCNADGVCEIGGSIICGGCAIDGIDYRVNEVNPADPCQVCDSSISPTSWTLVCSDTCCAPLFCLHDGGSHCGVPD